MSHTKILILLALLVVPFWDNDAQGGLVRYSFQGWFEDAGADPWGVGGDGSSLTRTDGSQYTLEFELDQATFDSHPFRQYASFFIPAGNASITVNGESGVFRSTVAIFHDTFATSNTIDLSTNLTLRGVEQRVTLRAQIPHSFTLGDPGVPPVFADQVQIGRGANGTSAHDTIHVSGTGTIVSASLVNPVPEPASIITVAACTFGLLCRRRRRSNHDLRSSATQPA